MRGNAMTGWRKVTRRRLIECAALLAGLAVGGISREAAARTKLKKRVAKYQDHPKGIQRCEICLQFRPPGTCQLVEGEISPHGWCQYFAARENAQ